jgi:hypothetical protein
MSADVPIVGCHRVPGLLESGVWQLTPVCNETAAELPPSLDAL